MLASGAAGLLFAFAIQGSCSGSDDPNDRNGTATQGALAGAGPRVVADPASLDRLHAWCDEARTLTPTEVWLDEQAHERWLFRRPDLEAIRDDPSAPADARAVAGEALGALGRLGL